MLKKLIRALTPDYNILKYRSVFFILFGISLFIRLPFFFRDYIDRDESTFILMGQSWVDGNLPYTELWDLKPPITYLFFAGLIYVFGKSFFAIRCIAALVVVITALYSYKIALLSTTKKVALWAAIGCVVLLSMFGSLQGLMSEHLSMLFFMPGLYLFLSKKNWLAILISGLLMGLTVMTKLNMAYVVVFLGIYLLIMPLLKKKYPQAIVQCMLFALGIVAVILLTVLPYYLEGSTAIWWKSVVLASLEYAGARRYSLWSFVPMTFIIGGLFYLGWKKKYLDYSDKTVQLLSFVVLALLFTFIKGGRINGHYLIQLHPVFVILFAILVSKISLFKRFNYQPYVFFLLLLLPVESYLEYANIIRNKLERGTFYNGEGISVPQYIKQNKIDSKNILFLGYHIGYWNLNAKPPTKSSTHPSNICRNELFQFYDNSRKTGIEEITFIMEKVQPSVVVIRKNKSVFDPKNIEENQYINEYLKTYYQKPQSVDLAEIYIKL